MSSTFRLDGQKALKEFLRAMPDKLRKGAVRSGLSAAAAVYRDEARVRVPVKSGKLRKAIKSGKSNVNQDGSVSIRVRLRGDHAYLGLFLEYGVAGHLIAPREGKKGEDQSGGALKIGNQFVAGQVEHPGFAAQPFLRPAFDASHDRAYKAFERKIVDYLQKRTGITAPVDDEGD